MDEPWFVRREDRTEGPYRFAKLKSLADSGRIRPHTRVRQGAFGVWKKAESVPGLLPAPQRLVRPEQRGLLIAAAATCGLVLIVAVVLVLVLSRSAEKESLAQVETNRTSASPTEEDGPSPTVRHSNEAPATARRQHSPPADQSVETERDEGDSDSVALAALSQPTVPDQPAAPTQPMPSPAETVSTPKPQTTVKAEPPKQSEQPVVPESVAPLLPPIPNEKSSLSDSEISSFHRLMNRERTAKSALLIYERFAASHLFTPEQQERVDEQLAVWRERAEADLHRLGTNWGTRDEVLAARQSAKELIERAAVLMQALSWEAAIESLEEASDADPNGIRADYLLGLLRSLPLLAPGLRGTNKAEQHFRTVLKREPEFAPALNSLAVTLLKQHEESQALNYFERAAELSAEYDEIAQNLGRFTYLVQSRRIAASDSITRRYSDLYARLIAEGHARPFDADRGWMHMLPPVLDDAPETNAGAANGEYCCIASGSGFVVAPDYVLTNRHVVYDSGRVADRVRIQITDGDRRRELVGTVAAVAKDADLAIVRFPGLAVPPLRFQSAGPRLADEIMILGYPVGDVLGTSLKATRGGVAGLPDPTRVEGGEYLLFDASAGSGNSGGPVITSNGEVAAVATAVFGDGGAGFQLSADLSLGVPASVAIKFLKSHLPEGTLPSAQPAEELDPAPWADVVQRVAPGVLRLEVDRRAGLQELDIAARASGAKRSAYEDYTCPNCSGLSWVGCPNRGCASGRITVHFSETVQTKLGPVQIPRTRQERCPICSGRNRIDCRGCESGLDAALR